MAMQTYTDRSNCARAAKKALKDAGVANPEPGVHFEVSRIGKGFQWVDIREDEPAPAKKAKRKAKVQAPAAPEPVAEPAAEEAETEALARENTAEVEEAALALAQADEPDQEPAGAILPDDADLPDPPEAVAGATGQWPAHSSDPAPVEPPAEPAQSAADADEGAEADEDAPPPVPTLPRAAYGLTGEVEAMLLEWGAARGAERTPVAKPRSNMVSEAEAAAKAGAMPPLLMFKSAANYSYQRHADALHKLGNDGKLAEVEAYPINGTNTYAKALRRYRDAIVVALKAATPALSVAAE